MGLEVRKEESMTKAEHKVKAGAEFACIVVFLVPFLYCCVKWVLT
jgi:hypothetical protein